MVALPPRNSVKSNRSQWPQIPAFPVHDTKIAQLASPPESFEPAPFMQFMQL